MRILKVLKTMFASAPKRSAKDCHLMVKQGKALLIDVREPREWEAGVAELALLLPLSDLNGSRTHWNAALEKARGKELFLHCAAGARSGMATKILNAEGFLAFNTGGYKDWVTSGWPTQK